MENMQNTFDVEVRIPPKHVIAFLWISCFLLFLFVYAVPDFNTRMLLVLVTFVVALVLLLAWNLEPARGLPARWLILLCAAVLAYGWGILGGWQSVVVLAVLPVVLASTLISPLSGLIVGLLELAALFLFPAATGGMPVNELVPLAVTISLVVLMMLATQRPITQVVRWTGEFYFQARASLEDARNRKAELERAMRDLEEANLQQTRLNRLAHDLRQVAEDARAAKAQFVANVSHELRTPLNMITGFTEMILQSPQTYGRKLPPALLADLSVIHRNAEHLKDLIDDVLDLSQIEAEQMALSREYVQFEDIIDFAATAVRPLFDMKKLYLKINTPDQLPAVYCDQTRIREVMLNLLSNAGRFTEQGGVEVKVWPDGDFLMIAVSDTGPGIAEEDLRKLFRPFQQVDGTIRRRYGGTGLGLAISKQFIEMHDGTIWVESQPGAGTRFTFRIPIAAPAATASDYARWFSPYNTFESRTHIPVLPSEPARPRYVIYENGNVMERLVGRYLKNTEVVTVDSLEGVASELARLPAQALLVNTVSISATLEQLEDMQVLPKGTPAIICSVPGAQEASISMDVSGILIKPISRDRLMEELDRQGVEAGTVLIVDDEPDALQLFGRMLTSGPGKYRILQARDGLEALAILQEQRPDIILLDLVMPNMDGFQVLAWRHEHAAFQDIPIIIISARDPVEQPIVSSRLAVTQPDGFTVRQLLASIEVITQILSPAGLPADPARPKMPTD